MSCNGCTKRFGLFLKEIGCPSCKYSFCSKCLKFRIKIDGKNRDVCLRCYELSKHDTTIEGSPSLKPNKNSSILDTPVDLENHANVIKPETRTVADGNSNDEDSLIRERLAALKQRDCAERNAEESPSCAETTLEGIEKRLAALKGVAHKDYSEANKKFLLQKDNRTEEEQIKDLMKQFAEEQELHDSMTSYRLTAVDDIEKRLAALKDAPTRDANHGGAVEVSQKSAVDSEEEENEEDAARKLAVKFLEEAAIDAKNTTKDEDELNNLDIPTPLDPSETEELPWCTICNEDAVVRCIGCDGDLFCRSCFKECHDDEEYRQHETKSYKMNHVKS